MACRSAALAWPAMAVSRTPNIRLAQELTSTGQAWRRISLTYMLGLPRSEEHTSELQSLMRISYAVFCLKKKKKLAYQDDNEYGIHKRSQRRTKEQRLEKIEQLQYYCTQK